MHAASRGYSRSEMSSVDNRVGINVCTSKAVLIILHMSRFCSNIHSGTQRIAWKKI